MAQVLSGSEKYHNLYRPRRIRQPTSSNSAEHAARFVSHMNIRGGSVSESENGRMQTICEEREVGVRV